MELSQDQRLFLRTQAHQLHPVVMIGNHGLSESVIREIAVNLDAHELIKVRVLGNDREQRESWLNEICTGLNCVAVQHIGKLFVLFRQTQERRSLLDKSVKTAPAFVSKKPENLIDQGRGSRNKSTKNKKNQGKQRPSGGKTQARRFGG